MEEKPKNQMMETDQKETFKNGQENKGKKSSWYNDTQFGEEVDNHLRSLAELAHKQNSNMFTIFGDAGYCTTTSSFDNASAFMTTFSASLRHIVKDHRWMVAMMVLGLKSLPDETIQVMLMEKDDEKLYAMLAETFTKVYK